jgi:hypothetical protein
MEVFFFVEATQYEVVRSSFVAQSLLFYVVFCRSLFVLFITPLVPSNFSYLNPVICCIMCDIFFETFGKYGRTFFEEQLLKQNNK